MKVLRVKCGNSVSAYGINKGLLYVLKPQLFKIRRKIYFQLEVDSF